jgi:hypothetical protein
MTPRLLFILGVFVGFLGGVRFMQGWESDCKQHPISKERSCQRLQSLYSDQS